MSKLIQALEKEQMKKDELTLFNIGDTVVVHTKIKEGNRSRLQAFEGVVISKKRPNQLNASFTVRKTAYGEAVERVFQTHSPLIAKITRKRRGKIRRAKLYYLRKLTGKKARIKEKV